MKKIVLSIIVAILFCNCKTTSGSNAPITGNKLDRSSQVTIKGNWKISSVTYTGSDYIQVNSFQIADSKCFVGSTWTFISNNNKGTMNLTTVGCTSFSSPIVWSINTEGVFVLKIVEAGTKSKTVTNGYLLRVANQTASSFQLIDSITVGNQKEEVTYQFEKIN